MKSMKWMKCACTWAVAATVVAAWGCGGGSSSPTPVSESGSVFVTGTDAPLPSMLSFQVDIIGLAVADGGNHDPGGNLQHRECHAGESANRLSQRDDPANDSADAADDRNAECYDVARCSVDTIVGNDQLGKPIDGERGRHHLAVFRF